MARILSVPCSSGEEPYSIAMALTEEGIPSTHYLIEGVDISYHLIQKALQGVYGKNAFRAIEDRYFSKYFSKKGEHYLIKHEVKSQVLFKKGNVFDKELFATKGAYDAIFCRNLLIYLEPLSQKKLLGILARLLKPEGRLFVAPSELETARMYGFKAVGTPQSCALRFESGQSDGYWIGKKQQSKEQAFPFGVPSKAPKAAAADGLIKSATEYADSGQFDAARQLCNEHLAFHHNDPAAYYLLGVIAHATGEMSKAESYFQKTVYLSPTHHEALVYLSLLMEKRGDHDKSRLYRERAGRCLASEDTKK